MKSYEEIARDVLKRRNERQRRIKSRRRQAVLSLSIIAIAVLSAGLIHGILKSPVEIHGEKEENQSVTKITETETEVSTDVPEMSGGWCIPALPTDRKIAVTGEEITDEEAKRYFDGNGNSILNSLQESGVEGSLRISEKGYCHVSYDGTAGKSLELRQNYRDYHVYGGERLVGIITLYKENGVIYNTVSFGAPWFDDFGTYLKEHEGEEIVFVYASFFEIIIAPDNSFINPMGHDPSRYLEGTENPYETFRHPLATYTP